ncbi:hypothetical protein [Nonomuraea angiospora]|uniref:hypothetical protein n=1 Tax=Nonomuraea angiospora TaxID=46172 RepID=UPI0029BF48AB|nr:hypothetical protein [Nonomuraea angiospora]MDX3109716.1 hypothetical protein [Nonomuraea angiospora]
MRTQGEIVGRVRAVAAGDFFGWHQEVLLPALDFEHAREFLRPEATKERWEEARHGNDLLEAAKAYYGFALGKIRDHRGISAERSTIKLAEFAWLLGRDDVFTAMDSAGYAQYGAPKVKAFGEAFGLAWPDEPEMVRMAAGESCEPGCSAGCGR